MILIFYLIKIMLVEMKKNQGCLIPLPLLKCVFSWEIWNTDFLYIYTYMHGTEHCELKIFWGMRCWKFSVCFFDSPSPNSSHLGGDVLPVSFSWVSWVFSKNNLYFPGKCSRSWFWYWLLSRAAPKSAEPFSINEKKRAHNMSFQGWYIFKYFLQF